MYTLDEGPSESLTLRPEGTAPGLPRLPRARDAQAPAAREALVPVDASTAASARRPGASASSGRSGRRRSAPTTRRVDAELILLLAELLEAVGARGLRLRLSSLGTPATREHLPRATSRTTCARTRPSCPTRCARASTSTRCARSTPTTPARAGDGRRAAAARPPDRRGRASTSRPSRRCSTASASRYEVDPTLVRGLDYYTRTVFEFTSDALGAQSGVGGGGRYDGLMEVIGGAPTPGMGWAAGVERILLASPPPPVAPPPLDLYVAYAGPEHAAAAFRLAADARRAGHAARLELGGRSLKGQLKQADRAGARFVAILGEEGTSLKDMESGEQKTVEPDTVMHHIRGGKPCEAAARERLPRRLVRRAARGRRRLDRPRRRLGAPPPRPRRADLHRPARPLRASSSSSSTPRPRPRRTRSPSACAPSTSSPPPARSCAARRATSTRSSRPARSSSRSPRRRRSPRRPRRRSRSTRRRRSTSCCACATASSTCAATGMQRAMVTRHTVNRAIRDYLNAHDFLEIETPIMTRSTPEGARDFLVPSRLTPGLRSTRCRSRRSCSSRC